MAEQAAKHGTIWKRISDRTKFPRSLWYPVIEPLGHDTEEDWQQDFNSVSATVRSSMFTLLAYAGFCMLALGQPDEQILKTSAFKLPVIGSTVTVEGFMLMGPLLLIVLTFYLHIFVGRLRALKEGKDGENLSPPYLFNLRTMTTRILTALIFYWLPPAVLFTFVWKGAPFLDQPEPVASFAVEDPWWGSQFLDELGKLPFLGELDKVLLFAIATLSTMVLALIAIRRCPSDRRKFRNWFAWVAILIMVSLWLEPQIQSGRALSLDGADLSNMRLRGRDFSGASLEFADIVDTDLRDAVLSRAHLWGADLTGADLTGADLTNAVLDGAILTGADLTGANLTGALLRFADLTGADLSDADLTKAHLRDADLFRADLTGADVTDAWLWGAMVTCEQLKTSSGVPDSVPADLSDCMPQHAPPKPIPHGPFPITP